MLMRCLVDLRLTYHQAKELGYCEDCGCKKLCDEDAKEAEEAEDE